MEDESVIRDFIVVNRNLGRMRRLLKIVKAAVETLY